MNALHEALAERGAEAQIKPLTRRNPMPAFDRTAYRMRNRIERFFSNINQFIAIATRYEMHDENFLNLIRLASIRIWLRHNESVAYCELVSVCPNPSRLSPRRGRATQ
jgi:transposase